jgi:PEP-CTERM motif
MMSRSLIFSASLFAILSVASPSHATVDVYSFSAGSSAGFGSSGVESITGSFEYNTTTNSVSLPSVTLSGAGPESGSYTSLTAITSNSIEIENLANGDELTLRFGSSFGAANEPLTAVDYAGSINFDTGAVTGGAVIASAVPEPSTWAMMILGFAGLGFIAYRRKAKPGLLAA